MLLWEVKSFTFCLWRHTEVHKASAAAAAEPGTLRTDLLAGVDDVDDVVNGDAGLCDVGGEDHLKTASTCKRNPDHILLRLPKDE